MRMLSIIVFCVMASGSAHAYGIEYGPWRSCSTDIQYSVQKPTYSALQPLQNNSIKFRNTNSEGRYIVVKVYYKGQDGVEIERLHVNPNDVLEHVFSRSDVSEVRCELVN